jgi:hypothetical protein
VSPSVRDANGTGLRPKAIFVTDATGRDGVSPSVRDVNRKSPWPKAAFATDATGRDGVSPSVRDANRTSPWPKALFVNDATGRRHAGPPRGAKHQNIVSLNRPLSRIQTYQGRCLVCGLPEGLNA